MPEDLAPATAHVALGRVGHAREVADLVLYLAGDESAFVTGAGFVIDGGETAGMSNNTVLGGGMRRRGRPERVRCSSVAGSLMGQGRGGARR